jgi:hypothetical protein
MWLLGATAGNELEQDARVRRLPLLASEPEIDAELREGKFHRTSSTLLAAFPGDQASDISRRHAENLGHEFQPVASYQAAQLRADAKRQLLHARRVRPRMRKSCRCRTTKNVASFCYLAAALRPAGAFSGSAND